MHNWPIELKELNFLLRQLEIESDFFRMRHPQIFCGSIMFLQWIDFNYRGAM